jgi:hypothetical protein
MEFFCSPYLLIHVIDTDPGTSFPGKNKRNSLRLQHEKSNDNGKGRYVACYRRALTTVANLTVSTEAAMTNANCGGQNLYTGG